MTYACVMTLSHMYLTDVSDVVSSLGCDNDITSLFDDVKRKSVGRSQTNVHTKVHYGATHLRARLHTCSRCHTPIYGVTHLLYAVWVEPVSLDDGVILVGRQVRQLGFGAAALVDTVGYADAVFCG